MDKWQEVLNDMLFNYLSELYLQPLQEHCLKVYKKPLKQIIQDYNPSNPELFYKNMVEFYDILKSPDCGITMLFEIYDLIDDMAGEEE